MSDAPTPTDQAAGSDPLAVEQPPAQVELLAADPPAAEVKAAPAPIDIDSDPVARAMVEKRKAEEVAKLRAEAEVSRKTERDALEAKLRAEADERAATEATEAKRREELSQSERMQEQIDALAKTDAEREVRLLEANAAVEATAARLKFVRAVIDSGKRLAKPEDVALEDLAFSKAQELVKGGKTLPEAITELAESADYLFARPTIETPTEQVSTAAGSSSPRGSTSTARSPSAPPEFDALTVPREEFGAYINGNKYMDLVTSTNRH